MVGTTLHQCYFFVIRIRLRSLSRVERDLPSPDTAIRTCASQLLVPDPEHRVDTSSCCVLDANGITGLGHAVYIDVGVEGSRSTVLAVRSPGQREDAAAVE